MVDIDHSRMPADAGHRHPQFRLREELLSMSSVHASDPIKDLPQLEMPAAPEDLKTGSPLGMFKYLGPGLIMASASIGSGEIFFASRGGAVFGYVLLWTFLAAAVLKGVAVYSGTRYITLTGESPFARFGQIIPGPKNWFPVLLGILAVISFPSWAGGFANFLGQWSVWTFGFGNEQVWASVWILLAFSTLFFAGYTYVEKFQTGVVLLLILFVFVAVIVSNPNYFEVLRGLLPTIPASTHRGCSRSIRRSPLVPSHSR